MGRAVSTVFPLPLPLSSLLPPFTVLLCFPPLMSEYSMLCCLLSAVVCIMRQGYSANQKFVFEFAFNLILFLSLVDMLFT